MTEPQATTTTEGTTMTTYTERAYLRDVRKRLGGLTPDQRDAVLDDIHAYFSDAAEAGRSPEQAVESLGNPAQFTARIRAELGYEPWAVAAARQRPPAGIVVTLVLALAIGVVGGYLAVESAGAAVQARQLADAVGTLEAQDDVMTALARERELVTVASLPCPEGVTPCAARQAETALLRGVPEVDEDGRPVTRKNGDVVYAAPSAFEQTAAATERRDELVTRLETSALREEARVAMEQTVFDSEELPRIQGQVAERRIAPQPVVKAYNIFIDDVVTVPAELARATDDHELSDLLTAHQAVNEMIAANASERPLVTMLVTTSTNGATPGGEDTRVVGEITYSNTRMEAANTALERVPGDERVPPMEGTLGTMRDLILQGDSARADLLDTYTADSVRWDEEASLIRDDLRERTVALAESRATSARATFLITAGVAGVALLIALVTGVVLVARTRRGSTRAGQPARDLAGSPA